MRIEIIRAPSASFLEMLLNNVRPPERKRLEGERWGAIGLVQGKLINLYWSADVAEKAGNVLTVLVMGNCPQHIQMLAIAGQEAGVEAALAAIKSKRRG